MNATDDLGLSPEFLSDECIAREDDNYSHAPRCGGPVYADRDYPGDPHGNVGCEGCRHCCPPDRESKPYGYGIERFEDPALATANAAVNDLIGRVFGAYSLACGASGIWPRYKPRRDALWAALSRQSRRRLRLSEIAWDRVCDRADTHTEAVALYKEWALRALAVRFRDE